MPILYPVLEPYDCGRLDVGDGHILYWRTCGDPKGKPALVLHGGPGSGCTPWHRRLFDPDRYRIVLYVQRNCGRSTPHASAPDVDLTANTTHHLVADIERLRGHLAVEDWLILGGSWGSILALAYAEANPGRVTELVLFAVTAGLRREFDWVFRGGLAPQFPAQWRRLRDAVLPGSHRDADVVEVAHRLLFDAEPAVRQRAAYEWCLRESAIPEWPLHRPPSPLSQRFACAWLRPHRHPLHTPQCLARARRSPRRRFGPRWHPGRPDRRAPRSADHRDSPRAGPAPAAGRVRHRPERKPRCQQHRDRLGTRSCHQSLRRYLVQMRRGWASGACRILVRRPTWRRRCRVLAEVPRGPPLAPLSGRLGAPGGELRRGMMPASGARSWGPIRRAALTMTHIPDLAAMSYTGLQGPIRAVGWLESPHDFRRGSVAPELRNRLMALIARPIRASFSLGMHWCSLCEDAGISGPDYRTSQAVLLAPGTSCVYESPIWIGHYVIEHAYEPPDEFCCAVASSPSPGSAELRRALTAYLRELSRLAGGDHSRFFADWDEGARQTLLHDPEHGSKKRFMERAEKSGPLTGPSRAEIVDKHGGVSATRCTWANCDNRALADMAICFEHAYPNVPG